MKVRNWILAVLALVAYGAIAYAMRPATTGPPIAGSSISARPEGSLALARLWRQLGHSVQPWQQVPELLPADTKSVFVAVEPDTSAFRDKDVESLRRWVQQGHVVIWVSEEGCPLISGLAVKQQSGAASAPIREVMVVDGKAAVSAKPLATWNHLDFRPSVRISNPSVGRPERLFQTPAGDTIGAEYKLGRGTVVYWTASAVWENQAIGLGDNLRIPWELLKEQDILWDEFGHGQVAQSTLGAMFGGGRQLSLALFGLALLLYGWFGLVRFGTPRSDVDTQPRLGTDFRHALAWHLRQPKLRAYQLALLERAVRRRLAERLGMPENSSATAVDAQVAAYPDGELNRRYAAWRNRMEQCRAAGRWNRAVQTSTRHLLEWLNRQS